MKTILMDGTVPAFTVVRATRASRYGMVGAAMLVLLFASFPVWADSSWMHDFTEVACYLVFALMWNLLAGYGGMVSIGQQAFFGLGGYALVVLSNMLDINPFLAVPMAALLVGALAYPISYIAFRLQGGYFAIGTWVIAEVCRLSIANISVTGGGSGTSLTGLAGIEKATREGATFYLALFVAVAVVGAVYLYLRSKGGLAVLAIRDSEIASASQGIDVKRSKLIIYIAAAFGAALAGSMYLLGNLRISPDAAFSVNWTAFSIFIVMIGGIGTIEGPIVGVVLFYLLNRFFSDYGTWYLVGLGALAIVVTLYFPRGLWGWLAQRYDINLFPVRRSLMVAEEMKTGGVALEKHSSR